MSRLKYFKSVNDFIIGIALLALGVYVLVTDDIITGNIATGDGGVFVRPDVYVRLIGALLAFFSLLLVIKSINWTRRAQTQGFNFEVTREVPLVIAALAVYAFMLEFSGVVKYKTGLPDGAAFFIATFLLLVFLTFLFTRKENAANDGAKKITKKRLIIIVAYAVILDVVVWAVFSHILNVSLP
ncbi:MAG: tripartite tricarboxylate transporter TctB family protein [Spirochaetaceae bacterium]|jgi:hypothetical protein|nr:tripartite tricarboxylate transporter TctB family protein [Spirochaetaceae bacterium]